jgi:hypothetical protein
MPKSIQGRTLRVILLTALFLSASGVREAVSSSRSDMPVRDARMEKIAADLAANLEIRKTIQVAIVPFNDRVISVEPFLNGKGYRVEFERAFFEQLNEEEASAALAHEMGHVWIFSNPPHIHTESLANEIALRLVPRKLLEAVYTKLWRYIGVTGNLVEILGAETAPTNGN